jgi:hypothetical protein
LAILQDASAALVRQASPLERAEIAVRLSRFDNRASYGPPFSEDDDFDIRPEVEGNRIFLRVTNRGLDAEFTGRVETIEGTKEQLATPWSIRWRNYQEEERSISPSRTNLLELAHADGMGNLAAQPRPASFTAGEFRFLQPRGEELLAHLPIVDSSDLYQRELRLVVSVTAVSRRVRSVVLHLGFENSKDPATSNLRVKAEMD